MNYHFTKKSSNSKVGPIPVTVTGRASCPLTCGQADACYYDATFYTRIHWNKVDSGERGISLEAMCEKLAALPDGTLWRHNIGGDLPGQGDAIDSAELSQIVRANRGRKGFTYTHKPVTAGKYRRADGFEIIITEEMAKANRDAIARANRDGFTVNLSADGLADADRKAALGIAPVAVVVPADTTRNVKTPDGRLVVICPSQLRDNVTCATCKLCASRGRKVIIGFQAHGSQAKKAAV